MAATAQRAETSEHGLVITRIFDAPRDLLWQVWTEPQHLAHWWGPRGSALPFWKADLRAGGSYRFNMRGPDGNDYWNQGKYREVVAPERLVMEGGWTDAAGNAKSPVMVTTVTFEEENGKTKLTLRGSGFESASARDSHRGGWSQSFERLTDYLSTL
jgi:uncharacterized protein YndB with AHSA1/START domain